MNRYQKGIPKLTSAVATLLVVWGCDAASDVDIQPLPALERPSAEARLGLPEIAGTWRFAGWEIERGDSVTLERTFPSFGDLALTTQRLDSIAGLFALATGTTPVIGEVRRNGDVTMVTLPGGVPDRFIAGSVAEDTLWLELTSILAPGEWPQDARAAFVTEPASEPIAWIRGARPSMEPPVDSIAIADSIAAAQMPAAGDSLGSAIPTAPTVGAPGTTPPATGRPTPGGVTPPGNAQPANPNPTTPDRPQPTRPAQPRPTQPSPAQPTPTRPAPTQPSPTQPAPSAPADPAPDNEPEPEPPQPEPEVEVPDIPEPDLPPLLGDPIDQ